MSEHQQNVRKLVGEFAEIPEAEIQAQYDGFREGIERDAKMKHDFIPIFVFKQTREALQKQRTVNGRGPT